MGFLVEMIALVSSSNEGTLMYPIFCLLRN